MGPRQQLVVGLVIALVLTVVGLIRAHRRGWLFTPEGKVEYGYVLKLIPLSIVFATGVMSLSLTLVFFASWGAHVDRPGTPVPSLDDFMPAGYAPQYVMALVIIGALVTFALSLMGYMDHVNAGGTSTKADRNAAEDEANG